MKWCPREVVSTEQVVRYEPFVTPEGVRQVVTPCPYCEELVAVTPIADERTYALLLEKHRLPTTQKRRRNDRLDA